MQKAKIRWAIEGDENSKYFHAIINKKPSIFSLKEILNGLQYRVKERCSGQMVYMCLLSKKFAVGSFPSFFELSIGLFFSSGSCALSSYERLIAPNYISFTCLNGQFLSAAFQFDTELHHNKKLNSLKDKGSSPFSIIARNLNPPTALVCGLFRLVLRKPFRRLSVSEELDPLSSPELGADAYFQRCSPLRRICFLAWDVLFAGGRAHRDIKPDNVLFDNRGVLKLANFGFAEWFGMSESGTMSGAVGTPYYVALEVLSRLEYDEKCDV
ncbi:phosphoenolpyruvate carboxylase kinase 2-like protein [Tanacetum coccineum]